MFYRPLFLSLAAIIAFLPATLANGTKKGDATLEAVQAYKARGESVPLELWLRAKDNYDANRAQAHASLVSALADGGSNSTNATLVSTNPYVDTGNTTGKGNNALLPACLSGGGDTAEDAWYELVVTADVELTTWVTCESQGGTSYDTRLGIFDSSLVLITCNDDAANCGAPYYQSAISEYSLSPGTYYIVVDGYGGETGPYELNVEWVVAAGGCAGGSDYTNAEPITLPHMAAGTTVGACHNYSIDCELGPGNAADDYWYEVVVDTLVLMDVSTTCEVPGLDTRIAIVDTFLATMYCNDDDPGCGVGGKSAIDGAFLEPGKYYIIVEGPDTTGGTFELSVDTTHTDIASGNLNLPDIIVRQSDLYDNDVVTDIEPGRTHLRLSNGTANIGDGKLYAYGTGIDNGDGTENVMQRVWRTDNSTYDRNSGLFVFHETHNHIHIENWCTYRLREVLPNDGVGVEVAKGSKTSFCILDLGVYDSGLPNYNPSGEFFTCGSTIQGLSVGWVDVYSKGLAGQNIDITDVPDGTYWLESEVDPDDHFLEKDETNNIARIKVVIGGGALINPDAYEPNDSTDMVDARPVGGPNSPNLGPTNPQKTITGLTLHVAENKDYFKFFANDVGASGDFVSVLCDTSQGDVNIYLLDSTATVVDSAVATAPMDTIQLAGRPEGWYYVCATGANGDLSPSYTLTVNPPSNDAPAVTVEVPSSGTEYRIQATDTYTVQFTASDPNADPTWARVYANTTPAFDGNEYLFPTSVWLDGAQGFYVVNTAYLAVDTWWFYVEVTDGGTTSGSWSAGNVKLLNSATNAGDRTPQVPVSKLYAPSPNPFSGATTLRLDLDHDTHVQWRIYDVRGRLVHEVESSQLRSGTYKRHWDGRDANGLSVPSGVYFQRVIGQNLTLTSKLVILR